VNNLQLYIAIGLPTIAVISSLVISLVQISAIREDVKDLRTDMREIRSDIKLLTGKVYELMAR
jgi:hypothetical protein